MRDNFVHVRVAGDVGHWCKPDGHWSIGLMVVDSRSRHAKKQGAQESVNSVVIRIATQSGAEIFLNHDGKRKSAKVLSGVAIADGVFIVVRWFSCFSVGSGGFSFFPVFRRG